MAEEATGGCVGARGRAGISARVADAQRWEPRHRHVTSRGHRAGGCLLRHRRCRRAPGSRLCRRHHFRSRRCRSCHRRRSRPCHPCWRRRGARRHRRQRRVGSRRCDHRPARRDRRRSPSRLVPGRTPVAPLRTLHRSRPHRARRPHAGRTAGRAAPRNGPQMRRRGRTRAGSAQGRRRLRAARRRPLPRRVPRGVPPPPTASASCRERRARHPRGRRRAPGRPRGRLSAP
jgi:hypothetical protein